MFFGSPLMPVNESLILGSPLKDIKDSLKLALLFFSELLILSDESINGSLTDINGVSFSGLLMDFNGV